MPDTQWGRPASFDGWHTYSRPPAVLPEPEEHELQPPHGCPIERLDTERAAHSGRLYAEGL